mgnify:CR=1 FL=1
MENLNIYWLTRIFTYSSIQVKFIATFAAILIFIIIRKVVLKIVFKRELLHTFFMRKKSQRVPG